MHALIALLSPHENWSTVGIRQRTAQEVRNLILASKEGPNVAVPARATLVAGNSKLSNEYRNTGLETLESLISLCLEYSSR